MGPVRNILNAPAILRCSDFIAKYHLELWLLLLTPLAGELSLSILSRLFDDDITGLLIWSPSDSADLSDLTGLLIVRIPVVLALNAALLPIIVRRRRPMLTYAWGYAVTAGVVEAVSYLVTDFVPLKASMQVAIVVIPASLATLWFTWKASSLSFPHALSIVAIAAVIAVPGNVIPSHVILRFIAPTPAVLSTVMAVGIISIQGAAVWLLVKTYDDQQTHSHQTIGAMTIIAFAIALWIVVERWGYGNFLVDARLVTTQILPNIPSLIATYGIIILISYILWRRSSSTPIQIDD